MLNDSIKAFVPTFLYIKLHSTTGLFYFGKTIKDPISYLGSGKRWRNHCKKYGKQYVETIWISKLYYDPIELQHDALEISNFFKIGIDKTIWANLIPENGINGGGDCSQMQTPEVRLKAIKSSLEKYGVEYAMLHPTFRKKSQESYIKRFGRLGAAFSTENSILKRNETNLIKHSNKCAANKNGNPNSKLSQEKLRNRDNVKRLKTLKAEKRVSLPSNWIYKSDEWINQKIAELQVLPNPKPDVSKYNASQLARHRLLSRPNVKILMELKTIFNLKLGHNWFQRPDEWIDATLNEVVAKYDSHPPQT